MAVGVNVATASHVVVSPSAIVSYVVWILHVRRKGFSQSPTHTSIVLVNRMPLQPDDKHTSTNKHLSSALTSVNKIGLFSPRVYWIPHTRIRHNQHTSQDPLTKVLWLHIIVGCWGGLFFCLGLSRVRNCQYQHYLLLILIFPPNANNNRKSQKSQNMSGESVCFVGRGGSKLTSGRGGQRPQIYIIPTLNISQIFFQTHQNHFT